VASEANYDGIFDSLHTALSSMPAKLNNIRSLLSDYLVTVSNIPADNSYKQLADELYAVINGVYTDVNRQAVAAMEVCDVIIENLFIPLLLSEIFLQPISAAINAILPDGPARVTMAAQGVEIAALLFSPRQTLNEIYSVYTE